MVDLLFFQPIQLVPWCFFCIAYLVWRRYGFTRATGGRPLPPGPPGRPIVGKIFDFTQHDVHRLFMRYSEQYGALHDLHGLGKRIIVLNELSAINDLLENRAAIYSHRPESVSGGVLMGFSKSMILLPYGPEWRAHRKLARMALGPTQLKEYAILQEDIAASLAEALLDTPHDFFSLVRIGAGRMVIAVTYGIRNSAFQTECIMNGERFVEFARRTFTPGNYLCDILPFLKHAPSWVPFQCELQHGKEAFIEFQTKPFEYVKQEMDKGNILPSLTLRLLQCPPQGMPDFERHLMWVGGAMFGGMPVCTYATVLTFIMAMALNRDKQRIAQAEIDAVIGGDRLPRIEDRRQLPYVDAVIKETMRWQPALPLAGLSRCTAHDDFYRGFFIPNNSIIVPNVWAIAYDPRSKYNPEAFIPERFMDVNEKIVDPDQWAFGFGRRACPGQNLGENSVFILVATILSVFDILPPENEALEQEFTQHVFRSPKPFKCSISPRTFAKARLVRLRAAEGVA
ncbi:hypothetical protein CERSUDRAFT_52252 [Gelatoporia subvermispora B]|uniref:Cytochrome P450 n=1 Tax=Ceriporiopsis subvermispora (strain B) TaxID=914234 RepID=M2QW38_CERS8|nr:hypothetical protein CERSUDRAFT_52252 [Gelatoporia subvermispora B]